jgi:hypothetical protein
MGNDKEIHTFYQRFREVCGPPMVKLGTVGAGELWFYHGLFMAVTT